MKDPGETRIAPARPGGSLAGNVVEFCRLLNTEGIPVAPGSATIALAAIGEIDLADVTVFRRALKISLLRKPEDIPLFNTLFAAYWRTPTDASVPADPAPRPHPDDSDPEHAAAESASGADEPDATTDPGEQAPDEQHGIAAAVGARTASRQRRTAEAIDHNELDRLGRALAAELARTRSRRMEPAARGRVLDGRRLLRQSLRYGGIPVELRWRSPQISRSRVMLLCDVSRSMEPHARLLLQFASALQRHAWRVEVFLFASELVRVTGRWRESNLRDPGAGLDRAGGGTRFGESLETLIRDYGFVLGGSKTTTIVLSDGLDAGDPDLVAKNMAIVARRSGQVIWLNPLLATPGYEPIARGMAAALPYVDVFAPADGVPSLWHMVRALRRAA